MLWGISWANLVMMLATIPSYEGENEDKKPDEVINDEDSLESLAAFM